MDIEPLDISILIVNIINIVAIMIIMIILIVTTVDTVIILVILFIISSIALMLYFYCCDVQSSRPGSSSCIGGPAADSTTSS